MLPPPAMTTRRTGSSRRRVGDVFLERCDALADEQAVTIRKHADEPHAPAREVEHLRGARVQDQLLHVFAHQLLRADTDVDGNRVLRKKLLGIHVLRRADARNLGGRVKQGIGDLARDHVDLVHVCEGDDDICIIGAGAIEHLGVGGVSDHGTNVQPVLQFAQHVGPNVDDSNLVGLFARQMVGGGGTHLTCTEY